MPTRRPGRGVIFSLIELLVVFAVIMILLSILMPALGKAREMAQSNCCSGNLRQIGLAQMSYLGDFNDYFGNDGGLTNLIFGRPTTYLPGGAVAGSYIDNMKLFACPDDTKIARGAPPFWYLCSYAINGYLVGRYRLSNAADLYSGGVYDSGMRINQVASGKKGISGTSMFHEFFNVNNCIYWGNPARGGSDKIALQAPHNRRGNHLFCDGHAASMGYQEVMSSDTASTAALERYYLFWPKQ